MPVTSTGEASSKTEAVVTSEVLGQRKMQGKAGPVYGKGLPPYEQKPPIHVIGEAEWREAMREIVAEMRRDIWYSDPQIKWSPIITLDPVVPYFLRYDGRWHSAILLPVAISLLIAPPGMMQFSLALQPGWNVLNYPDGTQLNCATRTTAQVRYANRSVGL